MCLPTGIQKPPSLLNIVLLLARQCVQYMGRVTDGQINSYVESYLAISDKLDTLENELRQGNLEKEENDEILEMYDYLAEKIARYYIDNHYLNE